MSNVQVRPLDNGRVAAELLSAAATALASARARRRGLARAAVKLS